MSDSELSSKVKDLSLSETPTEEETFDPSIKKKKTKKSVAFDESIEDAEGEDDFNFGKKKKKSKKKKDASAAAEAEEEAGQESGATEGGDGEDEDNREPWLGTDRDYTYGELLSRFYSVLRAKNPELAGEKRRYTIVPPSVHRDGSKKTMFTNLVDICKRMNRPAEHVIQFLFTELGTTGSIDGNQYLILKGRFQQKQIEGILRRYILEYVTCKTCKSPETVLTKENRLFFITCESCGSSRSVATIKSGFMAQTTKRSRVRAAAS